MKRGVGFLNHQVPSLWPSPWVIGSLLPVPTSGRLPGAPAGLPGLGLYKDEI